MKLDNENWTRDRFSELPCATFAMSLALLVWTSGSTVAQLDTCSREFYRFVSSSETRMTDMDLNGRVSWTNPVVGVTGRFQRATGLFVPEWADYVQCLVTGRVMSLRLFDLSPPTGMKFMPGGTNSGTDQESGDYSLTVEAFYMDRAHVTKTHWNDVRDWGLTNGYTDLPASNAAGDMLRPVDFVSWYDVVKWCNARSEREGRAVAYRCSNGEVYRTGQDDDVVCDFAAGSYRLPTMVEWEYAARGGLRGKRYPWGDEIDASLANYDFEIDRTTVAGKYPANGYDLFDMAGNLWHWMWDWHPEHWGTHRAFRGGAWNVEGWACASGYSGRTFPYLAHYTIGFRTVLPDRKH